MRRRKSERSKETEASWFQRLKPGQKTIEVVKRTAVGVYTDGFTQAGNFAYLSLLAVFAFFIVAAAVAGVFGRTQLGFDLIQSFFQTVPRSVSDALRTPVESAMTARSGPVLWLSAVVGLWTTGSLIETIRAALHDAYGTTAQRPFWQYRLRSIAIIIGAVFLAMIAFSTQVIVTGAEQFVYTYLPWAQNISRILSIGRFLPFFVLFGALYILFRAITPRDYRGPDCPKWPGAVLVSAWWLASTMLLPLFLANATNYDLTYGSLAGVIIALIFFYLIGLGMVTGAHLNAALANEGGCDVEGGQGEQDA
nr:YihY/virulence factor BrkB family protein [Novosphingopyxis sp. YJ-S2-01]